MPEPYCCPNLEGCKLVSDQSFVHDSSQRQRYINGYCKTDNQNHLNCKRFITKNTLHFCPDFVFPDTAETPFEIMDIFDESETEQ